MDETTPLRQGVSRRTFLTTSAVIGVGAVLGSGSAGLAWSAPPPDCGNKNDNGPRFYLWEQVKDRTDKTPAGTNIVIVRPAAQPDPNRVQYYAIRKGGDVPGASNDLLLLPTNRIKGIECSFLWQPPQQNLWAHSWTEAVGRLHPTPNATIVLGVNSAQARSQDQLHIHLTQVNHATLEDLRKIKPPSDINKWMTTNYVLRVNDRDRNHKTPAQIRRDAHFRVVKYTGFLPNLFADLKRLLPPGEKMETQMLGVVSTGVPNTYYLLNSTPGLPGGGTGAADYIFGWPPKP